MCHKSDSDITSPVLLSQLNRGGYNVFRYVSLSLFGIFCMQKLLTLGNINHAQLSKSTIEFVNSTACHDGTIPSANRRYCIINSREKRCWHHFSEECRMEFDL
ncbi:hypothetical protein EB796_006938 [Bugula neritina]|uniref:Uncharacterized protein n=1 Tax=Bugula neritina TaxID=10212 RepID=A0A7J7K980_BUGNE|nr:hypothetical protein EB796_006938 [Bugula neritina]